MRSTRMRASVAAATAAATLLTPAVAHAGGGGGENITEGGCSVAATWKMKAARQDPGNSIDVEFEVDANRRGQQWRVNLFHDGRRVVSDVFTTRGLSGSFTVDSLQANRTGSDSFRARAVRVGDGQTCVGRVSF